VAIETTEQQAFGNSSVEQVWQSLDPLVFETRDMAMNGGTHGMGTVPAKRSHTRRHVQATMPQLSSHPFLHPDFSEWPTEILPGRALD
jgi:hypothetical protein